MSLARVALEPFPDLQPLVDAIEAGGGAVVAPQNADALVWVGGHDPTGLPQILADNPGIRWVQLPVAGIEHFTGVLDSDRTWTCAKGVYGDEVAEHALGLTLAGLRQIGRFARATTWLPNAGRKLHGASVAVLGGGGITESLIALLQPFGCKITVLRRSAEPVDGADETTTLADLHRVLAASDVVVLALALTPETEHVIDAAALDAMSDHAWLINVARGRHVDTDALVAALENGVIGGAALDVTDPEPLPDDHPLWSIPNAIITPHTANTAEMALPALASRVTDNVRRFTRGEALVGEIDVDSGF